MSARKLGRTELTIEPLIFGCNVLGWTLEQDAAFKVLDAYAATGFTAFDTSDSYGKGKSETILGNWMKARGNRAKMLVFTKVGHRDLARSGSRRRSTRRCSGCRPTTSISTRATGRIRTRRRERRSRRSTGAAMPLGL